MNTFEIHPDVHIGHVHLRVSNLERATAFYHEVLGFNLVVDGTPFGLPMTLLAAGDYHHHIALNTFMSKDGTPPPFGHTGLHHVAILYPNQFELARAVQRIFDHGYTVDDARDHGGTLSIYLHDLDDNGIELYYDRPREDWFDAQGRPLLKNDPFEVHTWLEAINASEAKLFA